MSDEAYVTKEECEEYNRRRELVEAMLAHYVYPQPRPPVVVDEAVDTLRCDGKHLDPLRMRCNPASYPVTCWLCGRVTCIRHTHQAGGEHCPR